MYESIKEFVRKAVQANFDISPKDSNVIWIAEVGYSVGPNTFYVVQSIIDAMCSTLSISQLAPAIPQFQVYFNDQIGINNLAGLLIDLDLKLQNNAASRDIFVEGANVP
ncbi:hypothetical protein EJ110_NYTH05830 [Nymphaea thermarum]|nr:hypothetical protein EJ110_NYTH05830 [Nymphaea thermarum]